MKKAFYDEINNLVTQFDYSIIASAILKEPFFQYFGKLRRNVYEVSLSFVIEQSIIALYEREERAALSIFIEKRGMQEDRQLAYHFQQLLGAGTAIVSPSAFNKFQPTITFKGKKDNLNGLQLADLIAYPVARYVIEPGKVNPSFEVLQSKIYCRNGYREGLRIFP